jgi:hypothetical protein
MTTHRITADIDAAAQSIAAHLAACAALANRMHQIPLAADDATLTAWLNQQAPADTQALFAAHGQLGEIINAASQIAAGVLSQWGITPNISAVDVRSVPEKLADQRRTLDLTESGFVVTTLSPEPEPEPQPE